VRAKKGGPAIPQGEAASWSRPTHVMTSAGRREENTWAIGAWSPEYPDSRLDL